MPCKEILITVIIALCLVGICTASAETIHVPEDYSSIQGAVDNASTGDTIIVADGTYQENVIVDVPNLAIRSENGSANCIIDGGRNGNTVNITADRVTIEGFAITGGGSQHAGVNIESSENTISSNNIFNNSCFGIMLGSSSNNNTITSNNISNNYEDITLISSSNNTVTSNDISNSRYGINLLASSNNNIITSNNVANNAWGTNNTWATWGTWGISLSSCSNNIVTSNNIYSSTEDGIYLGWSSNNNIITSNNISNNSYGIYLHSSSNNTIYLNNFINNSDNVVSEGSSNTWNSSKKLTYHYNNSTFNNYLGNYWGNYTGSDSNGDAIGDTPYNITDRDNDSYPLMQPFENYLGRREEEVSACFTYSPQNPKEHQAVIFDASDSRSNYSIMSYRWDFGDGNGETARGKKVFHKFDNGTYQVELTVVDSMGNKDSKRKEITVEPREVNKPVVEKVIPEIGGAVLEGISFKNTYTATVKSDVKVDKVVFELNGKEHVDRDGSDGWSKELDMSVLEGDAVLTVTAVDVNGNESDPYTAKIDVVGLPGWLETLAEVGDVSCQGGSITISKTVPEPPVDAELNLPDLPVIGGKQEFSACSTFGITYHMPDGTAVVMGEGRLDMTILGREGMGKIGAQGTIDVQSWDLKKGKIWVYAEIEVWSQTWQLPIPHSPELDVGISPHARLEARLDDGSSGISVTGGTLSPGTKAKGSSVIDLEAVTIEGSVQGDVTASLDVPSPYNPRGDASILAKATISTWIWTKEFTVGPYEYTIGPSTTYLKGGEVRSTGWKLKDKYGQVPLRGLISTKAVTLSNELEATISEKRAPNSEYGRITANNFEDSSPSLTRNMLVWSRQDPDKDVLEGRDIYWMRVKEGHPQPWGQPSKLTNNSLPESNPVVESFGNKTIAVWTVLNESLEKSAKPSDAYPHMEVAYSVYNGTWSKPQLLTSNFVMEFNPQIACNDSNCIIAWEKDTDNNATTITDRRVRYTGFDFDLANNFTINEIEGASPVVAAENNLRMAYFSPSNENRNGSIVLGKFDNFNFNFTTTSTFSTTRFKDLALAKSLAWVDGLVSNPKVHYVSNGNHTLLNLRNDPTSVRDLQLFSNKKFEVLAYRCRPAGQQNRELVYRVKYNNQWVYDRSLAGGEGVNLTFWQPTYALSDRGFTSVFMGRNFTKEEKNDLFFVKHGFLGDLTVNASASQTELGDRAIINYSVANVGDVNVNVSSFGVKLYNSRMELLNSTTLSGLQPGQELDGSFVSQLNTSGFIVKVDPSNSIPELSEDNNKVEITLLHPDYYVKSVDERRSDNKLVITASVKNGGYVSQPTEVPYTLYNGNKTLTEGNASVAESSTIQFTVNVSDVNRSLANILVLDSQNQIKEGDEGNNTIYFSLLRPDLVLDDGAINYSHSRGSGGIRAIRAEVLVGNRGTGSVNATLAFKGNNTIINSTSFTMNGSEGNSTVFQEVLVPLPARLFNQSVYVSVEPNITDKNPMDNLVEDTIFGVNVNISKPNIVYEDLNVSPTSGVAPLNVTANAVVENTGNASGVYNATLKVDGSVVDYKTGELDAGNSTEVSFNRTLETVGTYNVTIDGLAAVEVNVNAKAALVSIGSGGAAKGEDVAVPLRIHNVTNLGAAKVNLTYNKSVVNVTGVSNSDFDFSRLADRGPGWVLLKAGQRTEGLNGTVRVCDVTLRALGTMGQTSALNLTDVSLEDMQMNPIPCRLQNGTFRVGEVEPPAFTNLSVSPFVIPVDSDGKPTWGETAQLNVTVSDRSNVSVKVNLSPIGGSVVETEGAGGNWSLVTNATVPGTHNLTVNATDEYGNSNTTNVTLKVLKNGDVYPYNGNGKVDFMHDALYLVRHTLNVPGYGDVRENVADVAKSHGKVDFMHDALYLVRHTLNVPGYEVLH